MLHSKICLTNKMKCTENEMTVYFIFFVHSVIFIFEKIYI